MNAALALLGAGLLCAGSQRPVRGRVATLARSGRLRSPAAAVPPKLRMRLLAAVAAAAVPAVGALAGWLLGVAAGLAGAAVSVLVHRSVQRRRTGRRQLAFVAAVRLAVAELDAGARPETALAAAAEVGAEHGDGFAALASTLARGDPSVPAPDGELGMVVHAVAVADRTGAALAGVLGHVADDVEHAHARAQRLLALTAGPRSSATMLALLPLLGIAMGASIGADPLRVLFTGSAGQLLCCCGVLLDALGLLWTFRIIDRAGRGS